MLTIIDETMKSLTAVERAQIDLIVIRNINGERALLPRSFVGKYSVLLARSRAGKPLAAALGPLYSVPSWTTRAPKILEEKLPLESLFVPGVVEVVLTNYKLRLAQFLLLRKTDPSAMRGEKLFIQGCAGCHATRSPAGEAQVDSWVKAEALVKLRGVATSGHPSAKGLPGYGDRERRALTSYVDALIEQQRR